MMDFKHGCRFLAVVLSYHLIAGSIIALARMPDTTIGPIQLLLALSIVERSSIAREQLAAPSA
jgi:hypothetical protein